MKKLIIILSVITLAQFTAKSQSEDYAMLCNLYNSIEHIESRNLCTPWASSPRLVNIKTDNVIEKNLFLYEQLWLALQKTCLKDQRVSKRLKITLTKRGKVKEVTANGKRLDLKQFPTLRKKRFKTLSGDDERKVKIYTNIG